MTDRTQLGWRVPVESWNRTQEYVEEKHADQALYYRVEIETAMMQCLDDDGLLAEAKEFLRTHTDLSSLSSSTGAIITDRYQSGDTKLVTHRIRADLKERFKTFADKHDVGYGRLLAAALDSYVEGGTARRIFNDVKRAIAGATSSGSTVDSVENESSTVAESGSTTTSEESSLSTTTGTATSSGSTPDPIVVADAAKIMLEGSGELRMFPEEELNTAIAEAAGTNDQDTIERYHDPVLDQLSAGPHPHLEDIYITDHAREEEILWADLDKAERIILLRRWAVAEAISSGERQSGFSYTDVQDVFEDRAIAGPSHQYAYDLMEDAADEAGFKYGKFSIGTQTPKTQLRVDVSEVDESILDWVRDECGLEPDRIGVIADVTSYSAGPSPDQEAALDDD